MSNMSPAREALEILYRAGYRCPKYLGDVKHPLEQIVGDLEQVVAAAEAKEQAELEAEALELYRAAYDARGLASVSEFRLLSEKQKKEWLAVARRAREISAEK